MAGDSKSRTNGDNPRKPRASASGSGANTTVKKHDEPRPAPSFVSTLKNEEIDFPRGGGTSLTALEVKQTRAEGRREAEAEAAQDANKGKKRRRQISEREAKRLKKNQVDESRKERDKDTIRVEELNYKRLVAGTKLLARVHTVLPLHLILSLPNNLLAHVPITEVSQTLTTLLHKEEQGSDSGSEDNEEDEEEDEDTGAPDLAQLFVPGMYVPAKVLNLYPTASQSFISQYPISETTRLAARVEMTLIPEKVNGEVVKADLENGFTFTGEILSIEDKGYRVGMGLSEDVGGEGWVSREEATLHGPGGRLVPGQLVPCAIASSSAGGRIYQLTLDPTTIAKSQLNEVSNVASILPGHLVSGLITAVVPSGLNLKISGFYDGTIDLAHLDLKGEDIDEKFKIGKKIRARVIYDSLATTPRRFGLSVLPHILSLTSPIAPDGKTPMELAIPIGKLLSSVKITRVIQEWGVLCRTDDGLEGFVHISHVSDERIPALSGSTGPFRVDTLHRARVIGHSPLDGILLLSFEQKVLDQVFMQVDELHVGQALKGTIHRLTDKGLFINIQGSVHGMVWPTHYADIRLKHPEKRFKVGNSVKARVFALEPARSRVILTLKKSLVDSELPVPSDFGSVETGMITPAVVSKILDKGCIVDLFGGLRAFVPQSEASQNFISNLNDIFFVGKPVNVRITDVNTSIQRLVASVRQALPTALASASLEVTDEVAGIVSQVHADQVVLTLIPSQITALLSLSNLSNHRNIGIEELRGSLKVGERLDDLIVVSKNAQSGLVIVANKRAVGSSSRLPTIATEAKSGISAMAKSFDSIKPGSIIEGTVASHTPQGTMVQLTAALKGRVHPTDAADDFSIIASGQGPLNVGEKVKCYVLKSNPATRIIDLSTRPSRLGEASDIVDPEVENIADVKEGMKIRGLVKNVSDHGVFVAIGRNLTARVMIKELFDDFVKDWQSKFEVNQLVSGKILSVNETKKTIEMTLRTTPSARKAAPKRPLSDFSQGQIVDCTVKKVESYGLFLRINETDISGLCHRSEISDSKSKNIEKALKGFRSGDGVKAYILDLDREKGRLNFSLKPSLLGEAADEDEDMEGDEEEEDEEAGDEDEEMSQDEEEEEDEEEGEEDEESDSGNELDFEDGESDEEDEDEDEDEDVQLDLTTPKASVPKPKAKKAAPVPTLSVTGGFDWTGNAADADEEEESASDSESDEAVDQPKSKSKGKQKALDLTASAPSAQPSSTSEFERALLSSPNSSFLWIQYMSFLLTLHEVDKARAIGRKAVEKIAYREEEEKLNVWMALVNLEIGFGTEESREKVWKEAASFNDAKTVWMRYADALQAAGKEQAAEDVWTKAVKKFSAHSDVWTKAAEYWFKKGDVDSARELLPRSLKSLDKSKHVETIEKFAVMEFRHADAERGKTLFEELIDRYPRRLDLVSVYIDQLTKTSDIGAVRGLVDRTLNQKLTAKKAKFLFKKLLSVESKIGDEKGEERAKEKAREWVLKNAKDE